MDPHRLSPRQWVLVTGVAVALRLALLGLEPPGRLVGDERVWTALAREVLSVGFDPLRSNLIFYPPLFPHVVAFALLPAGGLAAAKLLQVLAGALLVAAIASVGGRVFGNRTGLVAGLCAAAYPDLVWYSVHLWSEPVFMAFLWWGLDRLLAADEQLSARSAAAAGALLGLATLTRETILYFLPLAALWMAWRRPRGAPRAALLLAGAFLVIAPWTVRNAVRYGAFVPVSIMGGRVLWEGNTDLPRDEVYARYDAAAPDGPMAQYRLAVRSALEHIRARQPWWILEKVSKQVPGFFAVDSLALVHVKRGVYGPVGRGAFWVVAAIVLAPYVAVVCSFLYAVFRLERGRRTDLLLLLLLYYVLLHVAVHGFHRYRLAILPVLLIFAVAPWSGARRRATGPWGRAAFALLLAAFLVLTVRDLRDHARHPAAAAVDGADGQSSASTGAAPGP
jgi:4-amino-4-deoxy-L-arabinose transferase-like glycosyltransferase